MDSWSRKWLHRQLATVVRNEFVVWLTALVVHRRRQVRPQHAYAACGDPSSLPCWHSRPLYRDHGGGGPREDFEEEKEEE